MRYGYHWLFSGEDPSQRFASAGRGRGRGGPFGFGPRGPGGMPPFGGFPWSFFFQRPARARRGDVRAGILCLLAEGPHNGYQIMQELEERSRGAWRPSSGAVYPALQQLEDEGLVEAESAGGGRTFRLTERGRAYVEEHKDDIEAPWESVGETQGDEWIEMGGLFKQIVMAAVQVVQTGTPEQISEARRVLATARQRLYGILAEGDPSRDE